MRLSRREFLAASSAVGAAFAGLRAWSDTTSGEPAVGYGPLHPDPDGVLSLPKGFAYQVVSRHGMEMDDGLLLPGLPDGMATFPGNEGRTIVVRNHELEPDQRGPFGAGNERLAMVDPDRIYDLGNNETPSLGGTTTVVYDTRRRRVVKQFLSLAGTVRNCAGGLTPWGSWLSCEESVLRRGRHKDGRYVTDQDHGYVFEVPARERIGLADPIPLKAMGRFNHEAVAVDPATDFVYETEDRDDGLFYRFLPETGKDLRAGGRLQALGIVSRASADTRNWSQDADRFKQGQTFDVEWIDLDDVEAPQDDLRTRGFQAGAARFARGEGIWYGAGEFYFACTSGGAAKMGQIWRYTPSPHEGNSGEIESPGKLELFIEPDDASLVANCDNLTIAEWGDLIVCEDTSAHPCRLVGVTPEGRIYTLAESCVRSELAGAAFSPDYSTLFVNLQQEGLTLAITGPWGRRANR
ncbi:MAG: DUF839 domain-containing protein [Planctomycetota bacterium]|nr:MAG: DUF839 domain-containing protein [Planctomycetota bacterium]REJ93113.1 MAG: DUF839 domain-containing protein [Planctomycetota bacterium]REK30101.1 MAG: DUF839 domain-containing protein [Planctomycetota bacterium]REK37657.1 MAG: DUF839 domain-containing protein [Planctomycetota bacterium]